MDYDDNTASLIVTGLRRLSFVAVNMKMLCKNALIMILLLHMNYTYLGEAVFIKILDREFIRSSPRFVLSKF